MRRLLLNIARILLFLVCFGIAFWYSISWQDAGRFAVSTAARIAERNGMRLSFSHVSEVPGGFTVHNLSVNGGINFNLASLTIKPRILDTLLNLALVAEIGFTDASSRLGFTLSLGSGGTTLFVRPSTIYAENLHTDGDLAVSGSLAYDVGRGRISRADARLRMSPQVEEGAPFLQNFLPLVRDGQNWYLRR